MQSWQKKDFIQSGRPRYKYGLMTAANYWEISCLEITPKQSSQIVRNLDTEVVPMRLYSGIRNVNSGSSSVGRP